MENVPIRIEDVARSRNNSPMACWLRWIRSRLATVLHGGGWGARDFQAGLMLRNAEGLRASKRERAIEDMDGDGDLGILNFWRSRRRPTTTYRKSCAMCGRHAPAAAAIRSSSKS